MAANKKLCLKLINRFAPTANFPRGNPEAIMSLAECIVRRAISDAHAQTAVDTIAESCDRCPTEGDLVRVLNEIREAYSTRFVSGCPQCVEGWRRVWFLTSKNAGHRWTHERIDRRDAAELEPKLNPKLQCMTEAVERCACVGGSA